MSRNSFNNNNYNELLDHYFYEIGFNVPVIPADTENKETHENWSQWQERPIPEEYIINEKK
jgi:hypothetical protein